MQVESPVALHILLQYFIYEILCLELIYTQIFNLFSNEYIINVRITVLTDFPEFSIDGVLICFVNDLAT